MLPLVIDPGEHDTMNLVTQLEDEFFDTYGRRPTQSEKTSWKGSLEALLPAFKQVDSNYPVLAEYPVFDLERADFIIVGKKRALVIESKGWDRYEMVNNYSIKIGDELFADPCYQLQNYVNKLRYFHSASSNFSFDGVVFTYATEKYRDDCSVVSKPEELACKIRELGEPGGSHEVKEIRDGHFAISKTLVELVKENKDMLLQSASRVLLDRGYGLSQEQLVLVENVLEALKDGERASFLIKGVSGSGKTLVALTLLFEAVERKYNALLGYKNNRLLNTLRTVLRTSKKGVDLSTLILFYSTGPKVGFRGLGEPNFPADKYGKLDLAIFDEAQRMTDDVIKHSSDRARVSVYFYDDQQLLVGDEAGTRNNFLKYLNDLHEMSLSASFRSPGAYLAFLENILDGRPASHVGYDFKIFSDIEGFLGSIHDKKNAGFRVALVCSFTESKGDRKNLNSPKNLRIGYPLQSGFNLYKDSAVNINWLMDEKNQYPKYWLGQLDPLSYCASVYGAQGLEADFVGVVWGRDLIFRDGSLKVNPGVITDSVGGRFSLKSIARRDPEKAFNLLRNRYYVMLSRGIRGTYVFFEDRETMQFISSLDKSGSRA